MDSSEKEQCDCKDIRLEGKNLNLMCTLAVLSGSKCSFTAEKMSRKMVACTISELNRKPKIKKVFYQYNSKCLYGVIHIELYDKML